MSDREALETLINWFGDKEFLVGLMTPDRVDELAEQLGIEAPKKKTLRDKVGRWLSSNDGLEYVPANNKRFKLVVVSRADGSIPAVYQVRQVS